MGFKVFKIMRITNKEKAPIPVVSVYLYKNHEHNKEIFNLSRLFNCVISVEAKKKSYDIPQCYNCQRYGHTKNYCKQMYRCMKCAGNHQTKLCNQSNEKCVNCGENHTSNFKGCQYYSNLKKMRFVNVETSNKPSVPAAEIPEIHDEESFPALSTRMSEMSNTSFADVNELTYAKKAKDQHKKKEDLPNSKNIEYNDIINTIYEAIKPIIASVIEKLKPMIQDIIIQLFNGSK